MKRTSRTLLVAAAVSGLISGAVVQQGRADDSTNAAPGQVAPAQKMPKVSSCAGQNDCKGIGGCKTDAHACKFLNSCKGKGGCEISDKDIQNWQKQHQAGSGAQSSTNSVPSK
jgi:hypothetical protein